MDILYGQKPVLSRVKTTFLTFFDKIERNTVKTEIVYRATAELQEEIVRELEAKTPSIETAKAIINENTQGNDGRDSSEDNSESQQTSS